MGDLTKNFSRSEFACRCGCSFNNISPELVEVLEQIRSHFNQPVIINCGCRCKKHNQDVGGAEHSQHLLGTAADIRVENRTPALVADYLEHTYRGRYGIGRYSSFTHIDVRTAPVRWRG